VTGQDSVGDAQRVRELARRVERLEGEAEIARRLAGFSSPGPERLRIYRLIESESADFAVRTLCKVAGVSASAYYMWRSRGGDPLRVWSTRRSWRTGSSTSGVAPGADMGLLG